ncbi:TDT family transporter [Demetria terragena]|uniref:TDT family transporter n=1 Tax=Demetria terragena TaxID=63959 RepID=UPI00037A341E|nr:TDT family transporter [Demetria terragena]
MGPLAELTVDARDRGGLLSESAGQPVFGSVGPNWFASVMGTGIVANAAATLPVDIPGLLVAARMMWLLAVVLLIFVVVATALQWRYNPTVARGHLEDPVMSHFYGAPAMALMTVGAGAMLVGQPLIGPAAAVGLNAALWTCGTVLGLWTAVVVPYKTMTSHEVRGDSPFGGWLMPVVPPMVSAATGPLLIPHLPAGQWQLTMLVACAAMFGLTLVASLVVIALIWGRLVRHGVGPAATVPTLWIVLGPLGQSITAAHTIGVAAPEILAEPSGTIVTVAGVVYGIPMWGFAMVWAAIAAALTVRTARTGLPFTLTWWSFTFPVGTVVTGTSGLAAATGAHLFTGAAVVFYAGLVGAWCVVAARTARAACSGCERYVGGMVDQKTGTKDSGGTMTTLVAVFAALVVNFAIDGLTDWPWYVRWACGLAVAIAVTLMWSGFRRRRAAESQGTTTDRPSRP